MTAVVVVVAAVVVSTAFGLAVGRFLADVAERNVAEALDGLRVEVDALTRIADEMQTIRTEHGRRPLSPELVAWAAADALNPEGES